MISGGERLKMSKTIKEIAEEIGVSKQAIFKKIKREPLSTSLQGFTTTVDGRLMVSVDGEKLIKQAFMKGEVSITDNQLTITVDGSSTKLEEKSAEVDGQNALYEILKMELQAKNEQIDALQAELSAERQHSRELAEKIAELAEKVVVLTDQSQKLQLAQMSPQLSAEQKQEAEKEPEQKETIKKPWWKSLFS